jgi:hypothetical protein
MVENESGFAAGEGEPPRVIIELVAQHSAAVARGVEDGAKMRGERGLGEGIDQRARLIPEFGGDALRGDEQASRSSSIWPTLPGASTAAIAISARGSANPVQGQYFLKSATAGMGGWFVSIRQQSLYTFES